MSDMACVCVWSRQNMSYLDLDLSPGCETTRTIHRYRRLEGFFVMMLWRCRGEQIVFSGPNTNTNTIRFQKFGRIRIQILFGFRNLAEYEYEYYSGSEIWPNTNTNTNTNQSVTFVWILIRTNIRIYSCQENDTNEYLNIFVSKNLTRTNIQIYLNPEYS